MELLVAKDDRLWLERETNGLREAVEELGIPLTAFDKDPAAADMDCNAANTKAELMPELLLLSSEQATIDFAKAHFIPHLAVEFDIHLSAEYVSIGLEGLSAEYFEKIYCRQTGCPVTILRKDGYLLREICLGDLDELYALYEEPSVKRFVEPLFERAEEEAYLDAYIRNIYPFYDFGMWVVEEEATGRLVGRIGCDPRVFDRGDMEPELGYLLSETVQGQGLATMLCKEVLAYMWGNTACERIHCLIRPENEAAIRVAKKLGFRKIGQRLSAKNELLEWYILE